MRRVQSARSMLVAILMAASPCAAHAETLKLGVLTDFGGMTADAAGQGSVDAAQMAVDDMRAKLPAWTVEIVSADHQNKPDVGSGIARRWIDQENVDVVVGVPNSAVALAVQQVTKDKKRIFLITGGTSVDLTGKSCSPYAAHWTDDTYSLAAGLMRGLLAAGKKTFFFITVDYAGGHSLEAEGRRQIESGGGKVLGVVRHPPNAPDFSSFLLQAQASRADVIVLANVGADTIQAIKQAHEFGIATGGQSLVGMALFVTDVNSLGLDAAQGLFLSTGYYWDLNEGTRAFGRRFFARIGRMPTREQAETYSAALHYLRGVAALQTKDAARVMGWMKANAVDDFYAPGARLREDGRLLHPVYLAEVKAPADTRYRWDYYAIRETLDPAQVFRPLAEGGCAFIAKP